LKHLVAAVPRQPANRDGTIAPMRPIFHAELVNPPFGDPGLYLDLKFERRALLFDMGDLTGLPTRKLLRISDVFISHTHMDHFAGFDHWLRVCVGRGAGIRIFGPPHIIDQVEHKLHAYTRNLIEQYPTNLVIEVHEWNLGASLQRVRFCSRQAFAREFQAPVAVSDGVLLSEPQFKVRATALDHHGLPSLAFAFEEGTHINIWKSRLMELGLPTGQWLTELRTQVRNGAADDTPIRVYWRTPTGPCERSIELGFLKRHVLELVPGQKVCYATDVAIHERNQSVLRAFVARADVLFIETMFLHTDLAHAQRKAHLTAHVAGCIAGSAGVRAATPFHFSTRYLGREDELRHEFAASSAAATAPRVESSASSL
jgi:ribonuclease Z